MSTMTLLEGRRLGRLCPVSDPVVRHALRRVLPISLRSARLNCAMIPMWRPVVPPAPCITPGTILRFSRPLLSRGSDQGGGHISREAGAAAE